MKYKRLAAFLLSALVCVLPATVHADEVPDEGKKGTVTVEMEYDGKAVEGGTLTAYRVGRIREDDGNYSFEKTPDMEGFTGDYSDVGSAELAHEVAAFVSERGILPCATAENAGGKALFPALELGLYLIVQTEASDGYEPLTPFLVSVPMNRDGEYIYEINAAGKFRLHQNGEPGAPTTPGVPTTPATPGTPSEPTLPQTGQLKWPVPVLASLGLGLFSLGWVLRFGRKESSCEK